MIVKSLGESPKGKGDNEDKLLNLASHIKVGTHLKCD